MNSSPTAELGGEQIRLLYGNTPLSVVVTAAVSSILAFLQWGVIPHRTILVWLTYMLLVALGRWGLWQFYRARAGPRTLRTWGICFSIGDVSTKAATQGGWRVLFAVTLVLGYALGTGLLQIGYQSGSALTVAGIATLLTNALPIAAGTIIFDEPIPSGVYGGLRIFAFAAVTLGAFLLARPTSSAPSAAVPA